MSIALLEQYIEDTGLSQAAVAKQLVKSATTINQYLKGTYKGDVTAIDEAVAELVARYQIKDAASDFVPTASATRILEVCDMAHRLSCMNMIIGDAGLGKTTALKHYAATTKNVLLIETDTTYSVRMLLSEICRVSGIIAPRGNPSMMSAIIDRLRDSKRLLIIDEAELLNYRALETVRRIHDKTNIGIVFAGMPRLRANFRGGAGGDYKQLYSRIHRPYSMDTRLSESDIDMMCEAALGTDAFNKPLNDVCHGNARRLKMLISGVKYISELNQVPVNQAMIDQYASILID